MTEPVLNRSDRQSAAWRKIKIYLEQRIDVLQKQNNASLPIEKTQKLRGRIAEVLDLLTLDTDSPTIEKEAPLYTDHEGREYDEGNE